MQSAHMAPIQAAISPVQFIDTTLRDGNQSLWGATGLRTGMMLAIAPVMDEVGWHALDFTTSTHMAVAVRFHKEDPWERLRQVKARMPRTPLSFLSTGMRFISWETAHPELMALAYRLLARHGIERFMLMDPMNNTDAVIANCRMVRAAGASEVVAALAYTVSPVHDDAFFARMAATLAAEPSIDRLYLKDPGGLLTLAHARTLLPALKAAARNKPLELHSHCTIGLAAQTYAQAPDLGVCTLHAAVRPLGNGTSNPALENVVCNLESRGLTHPLDMEAVARVSRYFSDLARAEGLPTGVPQEYDERYFSHQLPGGMISTMLRQLQEIRQTHRLPQVYEEVARVRAELGWPIMVTPFSQLVGTMAVMNVLANERYSNVPDEVIRYVTGRFGTPPAEIDANVRDRIEQLPRTRELLDQAPMPDLRELRKRFSAHMDDEEFLLRVVMPAEQVDAMKAAGPCRKTYHPVLAPVEHLLGALAQSAGKQPNQSVVDHLRVEREGFVLELNKT